MLALGAMLCTSCEDDVIEPQALSQEQEQATLIVKTGATYDNHLMQVTTNDGEHLQFTWDTIPSGQVTFVYDICDGCDSRGVSVSHTDTTASNWSWNTTQLTLYPGQTYTYE